MERAQSKKLKTLSGHMRLDSQHISLGLQVCSAVLRGIPLRSQRLAKVNLAFGLLLPSRGDGHTVQQDCRSDP